MSRRHRSVASAPEKAKAAALKKYFAQALAEAAIVARCIYGLSTILLALTRNQVTMLAAIPKLAQTGQENRSCSCSAFYSA
jgi:hypothetical protein